MKIADVDVSVYRIPTDGPEADGTFQWEATTMVLVEVVADAGQRGLGFSYTAASAATLIRELLAAHVIGRPIAYIGAAWQAMIAAARNVGLPGFSATAISAIDIALYDLKARVAEQPLCRLLGPYREAVPIYGSGGFTNYTEAQLVEQLAGWVAQGIPRVKMKIGKEWGTKPHEDTARVRLARQAIGPEAELFVDANGAYSVKQAIAQAHTFAEYDVSYFEEPVPFDQLEQLAFIRRHIPMDLASGEYGYRPADFRQTLLAGAVDILQADVTRCLGVTGLLEAAHLAHTFGIPLSTHTAPSIHAQVGCAVPQLAHVEYFYDHARIEKMLFDGAPEPVNGFLRPDPHRPGLGLEFKRLEAEKYRLEL